MPGGRCRRPCRARRPPGEEGIIAVVEAVPVSERGAQASTFARARFATASLDLVSSDRGLASSALRASAISLVRSVRVAGDLRPFHRFQLAPGLVEIEDLVAERHQGRGLSRLLDPEVDLIRGRA